MERDECIYVFNFWVGGEGHIETSSQRWLHNPPSSYPNQVQGFPSNVTLFQLFFYYFIQIIRHMFRSYDHLQAEICLIYIFPLSN
jgi:hypothetical protein